MQAYVGTSGFSYKEWKGPFYPEKLPAKQMLAFYAERLNTVEINNTFYRLPKPDVVAAWGEQVPADFRFVIKASQRITHKARLADAGDTVEYLWQTVQVLGDRLGPILFQLPPFFRCDVERLRDFVAALPDGMRAAFEFRHESWHDDAVRDVLRGANAAWCTADQGDADAPSAASTADWGYLRLRAADYSDAELDAWAAAIRSNEWRECWVFFKHEDEGHAPVLAERLRQRLA